MSAELINSPFVGPILRRRAAAAAAELVETKEETESRERSEARKMSVDKTWGVAAKAADDTVAADAEKARPPSWADPNTDPNPNPNLYRRRRGHAPRPEDALPRLPLQTLARFHSPSPSPSPSPRHGGLPSRRSSTRRGSEPRGEDLLDLCTFQAYPSPGVGAGEGWMHCASHDQDGKQSGVVQLCVMRSRRPQVADAKTWRRRYDLQKCGLLSLLHGTHFAQWSYNVCAMEETALHPLVLGV